MSLLLTLAWVLLIVSVVLLGLWSAIALRLRRMGRLNPTVRDALAMDSPQGGWPKLSIIVPAHNEQRVIDACATSLREQSYPELEIIFVLDRCTDQTRAIIARHAEEDSRVRMIENDSCPDDWAGKCHAAHLGARQATGTKLLFTDADTKFEPDLARAAVALASAEDTALLSLLTTLSSDKWFERIAQPVASMYLGMLYPPGRSQKGVRQRPFANGQFLLFDRDCYEEIGGHEAVKDDLLEDLAFSRVVFRTGAAVGTYFSDGMLCCSMYGTYADFRNGWQRIFLEACHRKTARLRKYAIQAISIGIVAPLAQFAGLGVASGIWSVDRPLAITLASVVILGVVIQLVSLRIIYRLSGASSLGILTYPWGSWIVSRIMFRAASDLRAGRPIRWGGREYVLKERF